MSLESWKSYIVQLPYIPRNVRPIVDSQFSWSIQLGTIYLDHAYILGMDHLYLDDKKNFILYKKNVWTKTFFFKNKNLKKTK